MSIYRNIKDSLKSNISKINKTKTYSIYMVDIDFFMEEKNVYLVTRSMDGFLIRSVTTS